MQLLRPLTALVLIAATSAYADPAPTAHASTHSHAAAQVLPPLCKCRASICDAAD